MIAELTVLKCTSKRVDSSNTDAIDDLFKGSIRHYLETAIDDDVGIDTIRSGLSTIYSKEMLISRKVYEWANSELQQHLARQISISNTSAIVEAKPTQPPSLFSQSTLYHASLCCCAVAQCRDEENAHRFFRDARHTLNQVSFCEENSSENLDRYLIARNGDIIFVAFQSEVKLSTWLEKYNTFDEGKEFYCMTTTV